MKKTINFEDINWDEIDHIAYSFDPEERLRKNVGLPGSENFEPGNWGTEEGEKNFYDSNMRAKEKLMKRMSKAEFHFVGHHLAHASSAFHVSPYEEACVIAVDGIGEFASTWLGYGKGTELVCILLDELLDVGQHQNAHVRRLLDNSAAYLGNNDRFASAGW